MPAPQRSLEKDRAPHTARWALQILSGKRTVCRSRRAPSGEIATWISRIPQQGRADGSRETYTI